MKKISLVLSVAVAIITFCMLWLTLHGISLRSGSLIDPSPLPGSTKELATAVTHRLFAELSERDLILLADATDSVWSKDLSDQIILSFQEMKKKTVNRGTQATDLTHCAQPCWIDVPQDQALALAETPYIQQKVRPSGRPFMSLHLIEFTDYNHEAVKNCEQEKRLDFLCLQALAIKAAQRKMKDKKLRYFFLKQYNELDYFLFIQKA